MLINELFKPVMTGKWAIDGQLATYEFVVANREYTIHAQYFDMRDEEEYGGQLDSYNFDLAHILEYWAVEFKLNEAMDSYGITKSGNAGQVFGNIIGALRVLLQDHVKISGALFFTAKEKSRQSMYDALVKRIGTNVRVQIEESKYPNGSRGYLIT